MTRRQIIAATVEAIGAYVDLIAAENDGGNDLTARLVAVTSRTMARNIRGAENIIALMVEAKLGPAASYDLEQEGMR